MVEVRGGKRDIKRASLLDVAARMINAFGAGAINLNEIAERLGMSRNTIYYYVSDRADLVFQCYQQTCEAALDDLALAYNAGANANERLHYFIDQALSFDRVPNAILSDHDMLPEPQRQTILTLHARVIDGLAGIIGEGIEAGTVRQCDPHFAAQTLVGMLSWLQLSASWLGRRDGRATRRRAASALHDLFWHGLATGWTAAPVVSLLTTPTFNPFDRRATAHARSEVLVAAASRLFNRRGVEGVSLEDIATSVGATKGAVYHYFTDKTSLVIRCYERAFDLYESFLECALAAQGPGYSQVMTIQHLNSQAQAGATSPMILQPGLLGLPAEARTQFTSRGRRLRLQVTRLLQRGIADGSCRPCDASLVAEIPAGAFFWLPKWLSIDSDRNPVTIADELVDIVGHGIGLVSG